jgi:hypothetical protein
MQKYIPHLILALLVLVGMYLLFTSKEDAPQAPEEAQLEGSAEPVSDTPSDAKELEEPSSISVSATGGVSVPEGLHVVKQTAWATFTDANWSLSFK